MLAAIAALCALQQPAEPPRVEIGGRAMLDAGFFGGPDADEAGAAAGAELQDGAEVRRLRLDARAALSPGLRASLGLEFAGGDPRLRDASLTWTPDADSEWKLGYSKLPWGLTVYGSSNDFEFLEAPLAEDALAPGRHAGLFHGGASGAWTWAGGLYRRVPERTGVSENEGYGAAARAACRPLDDPGRGRLIHVAADLGWENPDAAAEFGARPEQHLLPPLLETGALPADAIVRGAAELGWTFGRFHGSAGWQAARLRADGPEPTLDGWHVAAGAFLTGETRPYDRRRAVWGRVVPSSPLRPGRFDEGAGAWEAVARLSRLDFGEAGAGELEVQSLGLNWYWTEHLRILLTTSRILLDDFDSVYAVALRVGFDF